MIKQALHEYFNRHEWQNTTLEDFVGCLQWALDKSENKTMGNDFNFKEWTNYWLKTSGINILEPITEDNEDGTIKTLSIK